MATANAQLKQTLRRELRARRRALSSHQQRLAAQRLIRQVVRLPGYARVRSIALYWAMDGEIDVTPLMHRLMRDGKTVYLPVLQPQRLALWFRPWQPTSFMRDNRFGIPEPQQGRRLAPWALDWVLLPLVGFDDLGGRLGMGGGFYDRTFAARARWPRQPRLIGVAHQCQQVEPIPLESWDIPLAAVVTDAQRYEWDLPSLAG
ncbi:5-formyltetrahydrofolate cyclo-ligase [Saccharospirillum mangrovi]|uniref:5-formyltetrahydrofolate cyclo-ligase n=1 Tax=Saccharospirillum mangrovi TaxID=2161747 RepID=UPI000D3D6DC7|nr:5-formyltetrahydrofolate cyclo-ligase [Saccharospirillum mangrovi]